MKSKKSQLEKYSFLEGKCHIFQREGSSFWWAGFHFKGKYIRTSTKETNKDAAEAYARNWYFLKQTEIASGVISNPKHTFEKIAEFAIEYYKTLIKQGVRSQKTLDGIESILKSRVTPYFAKISVSSIDNTKWHEYKDFIVSKYPNVKRATLHQYKNAIRVVLNESYRRGIIKSLPVFKDEYKSKKFDTPRPWFSSSEYTKLHKAILSHANKVKKRSIELYNNAMELYDYVLFGTNTGMRVGELNNIKFSDVNIEKERLTGKEILIIRNIKGKRGTGTCQSYYGAVDAFKRIMTRRGIKNSEKSSEKLFLVHHRILFNKILEETNLKYSNTDPPAKRDFVSLRATYICFRLMNGAPVYEIANNCRTSVEMIENSYARFLSGDMMQSINRTLKVDGWDR